MAKIIIKGKSQLIGVWKTAGSKNALLPLMTASLLIRGKTRLNNVPDITDLYTMIDLFKLIDVKCKYNSKSETLLIDSTNIKYSKLIDKRSSKMRASNLLIGPMVALFGKCEISYPGGDSIGARPLDTLNNALRDMQVQYTNQDTLTYTGYPKASLVRMNTFSVTASENLICAAVFSQGITELRLVNIEPHVIALCEFLIAAGAKIEGLGTHYIRITGVDSLNEIEFTNIPDQLESGTLAIAAAACTNSELEITDFISSHHDMLLNYFDQLGVDYILSDNSIRIKSRAMYNPIDVHTAVYPEFPTDLQAPMAVLMTRANGVSTIFETIYESRLAYLEQLNKLGANSSVNNAHQATIRGVTALTGDNVLSLDIRAGATLIIAAMIASGVTEITGAEHIYRGYSNIVSRLSKIGVDITEEK